MKTIKFQKINYITIFVVFTFSAIAYSFIGSETFLPTDSKLSQSTIEQGILGTWIREDDSNYKLVFGPDSQIKIYVSASLEFNGTFDITTSCDGETYNNGSGVGSYLKIKDPSDTTSTCQYINDVNSDNDGVLSLTSTSQMKTYVYIKQP